MGHAILDDMLRCETKDFQTFSITRFQLAPGARRHVVSSFTQPEGLLEIGLCLHGKWDFSMPERSLAAVTGSVGMMHLPGAFWQSHFDTGSTCRGIGIAIPLHELARYVADSPHVRKNIRALIEGKTGELAHFCSVAPEVLSLATVIYTGIWDEPLQGLLLEAKTMELLHHLLINPLHGEGFLSSVPRDDVRKLNVVREIILADLEANMTISELARLTGLSPSKLKSSFKRHFGSTIHDFIRQAKLEHAKRMIESGEMNVTEAALSVGYSSLGHFSRIFKDTFGLLPKEASRTFMGTPF